MAEQKYSAAGNPILRYDDTKPKEVTPVIGDKNNFEVISEHIEKYVGKIQTVFHEVVSDLVHISSQLALVPTGQILGHMTAIQRLNF